MLSKVLSKKNCIKICTYVLIALYGISALFLYYKQTQWVDGAVYESDLPAHIQMIIEDGWYYSLTAFLYKALYSIGNGSVAIACFLALCTVGSVFLTYILLQKISILQKNSRKMENVFFLLLSLILNVVMPCYVRGLSDGRYIGMESGNIWHNSTYLVMKPLALICLILYVDMMEEYAVTFSWKKATVFSGMLAVCTGVKPSFLVVFAPMMAILLLLDLIKGVPFKHVVAFGVTVVPSLAIILFQNIVLFGTDTGNSWQIRPGYALGLHSGYPMIVAVLSILFPLIVLIWNRKELKKERSFLAMWIMAAIGFLEVFLFCEVGARAEDGNFMWGYSIAIFSIFVVSILMWVKNLFEANKSILCKGYIAVTSMVLAYHIYCGVYFYTNLVQGVSYWMWD